MVFRPSGQAVRMTAYFRFSCPHCSRSLRISRDLAGQSRRCPHCRQSMRIPEPEPQPTQAEDDLSNLVVPVTDPVRSSAVRPPRRARRRRSKGRWFHAGRSDSVSTDVSLPVSGAVGFALTVIWLGILFPLRHTAAGALFWERGWVPFATTFLMFWSFSILFFKWVHLRTQREAMLLDVLPTELSRQITPDSADRFLRHIEELPVSPQESFLVNRVVRGLEHFRVRQRAADTATMLESQSAIDASNVAGSFALLKVFIWSLPILGFIGTVIGISGAVAGLAGSLDSASDVTQLKTALTGVFDGLKTAFDTTLLALIMSMMVKIPASGLQKSEEALITAVDEYCNENLLLRLHDGSLRSGPDSSGRDEETFRGIVASVLNEQRAELHEQLSLMNSAAEQMQNLLAGVARETADVRTELNGSFHGIARGLKKLNGVLERLGEQSVVVQQVQPRKRWFLFGRREDS